jgi:opacity protein-like surface antigen
MFQLKIITLGKRVGFVVMLVGFVNQVFATSPGPYVGLQLGWVRLNQGKYIYSRFDQLIQKTFPYTSVGNVFFTDTGRGARIFAGYQFNAYIALEIGYYRFSDLNFSAGLNTDVPIFENEDFNVHLPLDISTKVWVRTDAFDLVAKIIWPFTKKFSIYGKVGFTALNSQGSASVTIKTPVADISFYTDPSVNIVAPTYGIGMNYDVTDHASIDFSWNRIQKINSNLYPDIDFLAVGLMYHFWR